MNIDGNILTADNGMALKRKDDSSEVSTVTRVALSPSDSPYNWEDCEYGEPGEATRYSVRSIIRELKACGKYDAVRSLLEAAKYDWEFIGSNYLASDDNDFQQMLSTVVQQGIMTRADINAILPKCIWSVE